MKIASKALKNGFTMPAVGKGTWMTNIGRKPHPSLNDEKRKIEIKNVINAGIFYIDTAERYANGYTEILIGNAIKEFNREKLFLVSKVSSDRLHYDNVILSAKRSLKRLKTPYLDLYLIHQFNANIPLQETMKAMDYLLEKKLIKSIGVCDFTVEQLQKAQSYTKNKIVVNQLPYNLSYRQAEKEEIIAYCQKNDIMVVAFKPLEQKLLSSKTKLLLETLASKYKKTISQIATSWLMAQPNTVVLSKLSTVNKIDEMLDTLQINITKEDLDALAKENN